MISLTLSDLRSAFRGKSVCVIGSAPCGLENDGRYIDSFDEIVRVNNYKIRGVDKRGNDYDFRDSLGTRTDYHYSYYGGAVRKTTAEMEAEGLKAHLCKCPNDVCHVTEWHKRNNQLQGGDFRPIYRRRAGYWSKPVYIPLKAHYMQLFDMLNGHVPSTGLAAIWEVLESQPSKLYITGFDFMTSGVHNVNEKWKKGNDNDPVGHDFDAEKKLVMKWISDYNFIEFDRKIKRMVYNGV